MAEVLTAPLWRIKFYYEGRPMCGECRLSARTVTGALAEALSFIDSEEAKSVTAVIIERVYNDAGASRPEWHILPPR